MFSLVVIQPKVAMFIFWDSVYCRQLSSITVIDIASELLVLASRTLFCLFALTATCQSDICQTKRATDFNSQRDEPDSLLTGVT